MSFDYSACPLFLFLETVFCCWECYVYVLLVRCPLLLFNVSIVGVSLFLFCFPDLVFLAIKWKHIEHEYGTNNKNTETKQKRKRNSKPSAQESRTQNWVHIQQPPNIQQKQTINDKNNINSAWIISCFFFIFFCSPKLCWHCSLCLLLGGCPLFLLCVSVVVFVLLLFFVSDLVFVL